MDGLGTQKAQETTPRKSRSASVMVLVMQVPPPAGSQSSQWPVIKRVHPGTPTHNWGERSFIQSEIQIKSITALGVVKKKKKSVTFVRFLI